MALKTNTAEGGSNTTNVSTGNSGSGSGDAFSAVNPGAGGTIQFSTAQVFKGSLAYAFTPASGVTNNVILSDGAGSTSFSVRYYVYLTGNPSSETNWLMVQTTGGSNLAYMNLTTAGKLKLVNSPGSTIATFTNAIPLNTWTRIHFFGTINASTGTVTAKMFTGDSGTATETQAFTSQNTGSSSAGRVVYGKLTSTGTMAAYYFDDIAQDLASSTEMSASVTAVTPITRSTTWDALAPVSITRATTWNTAATVSTTRATTWNALATVTPVTRATTWNTLSAVSVTRATTWNTLAAASITRSTTWDVAGAITAVTPITRSTTWNTLAKVAPVTRLTTWDVLATADLEVDTTWNTLAAVGTTRLTTWDVLAGEPRDITVTVTPGTDRWGTSSGRDRFAVTTTEA